MAMKSSKKMRIMNNTIRFMVGASLAACLTGCALKGSKAEEKYEGRSTCSQPGFTCGKSTPGLDQGLSPSADVDQAQQNPGFHRSNNYAPVCKMKKDKCECACEPVP